ncbi:binding-protein-dependent transport systems inner membrane component [Thermobaculum terrenum ATCC BAA-798]|uniref:Binding-protein-dependent transport systems inner membrane component n=1 Tax=Thermobaculum terrenum (strain ATCC BAA-798 / CCMEE 7001 / YNP1) TaxID=525904 RepID=D1CIR3_THET1|nr:ABC transporter permease [Thermobaculum terrenum]ACZ43633.1 binding-protein-dependent transport systems inner membrane component [Thermobaculum terrenum ATCC BAA-798]
MRGVRGIWNSSNKLKIGLLIILFFVVVAVLNEPIVRMIGRGKDPIETAAYIPWQLPNRTNWLGTDRYGRDILALAVKGLAASLQVGAVAGLISTFIGVLVAFLAGYKGGRVDSILSGVADMFLVVPSLPILIVLSAYATNLNLFTIGLILAIFSWALAARVIRSQVLSLRTRPYVELAKVNNMGDLEIIFQELVPNLLPFIAVGFANAVLGSIFALVGLEVIGLGPSNVIDLGLMLNWAIGWGTLSLGMWPLFVTPIFILGMLFFAVNLINIGLEETYNPRLRKVAGA